MRLKVVTSRSGYCETNEEEKLICAYLHVSVYQANGLFTSRNQNCPSQIKKKRASIQTKKCETKSPSQICEAVTKVSTRSCLRLPFLPTIELPICSDFHPFSCNFCQSRSHLLALGRLDAGAGVGGVGVAVCRGDGVVVAGLVVLSIVGGVGGGPGLVVHGAVLANGLGVVQEDVSDVELASLGVGSGGDALLSIVLGSGSAGGSTETSVEGTGVEDSDTHVGIVLVAVKRSVDGDVSEVSGLIVARDGGNSVADVAVAACNDNLEGLLVLAVVDSVVGGNWATPVDTLDNGGGGGVGVRGGRCGRGVTLKVEVEGAASVDGVALGGTLGGVVGSEDTVAHVAVGVVGGVQVLERLGVSSRNWCCIGGTSKGGVG